MWDGGACRGGYVDQSARPFPSERCCPCSPSGEVTVPRIVDPYGTPRWGRLSQEVLPVRALPGHTRRRRPGKGVLPASTKYFCAVSWAQHRFTNLYTPARTPAGSCRSSSHGYLATQVKPIPKATTLRNYATIKNPENQEPRKPRTPRTSKRKREGRKPALPPSH